MNPFFIYIEPKGSVGGSINDPNGDNNSLRFQAKQVSLFPILPSITWNFKF